MKEILIISLVGILINNIIPYNNKTIEKIGGNRGITMIISIITLYLVLKEILIFNNNNNEYQERIEILGYIFGLDGIGITLIGLMGIIEPIIIILIKGETKKNQERKRIINYIITIKILIIILFSTMDIIIFYITFELILIPMFLLITRYGSKYEYLLPRLEASIRFFMYTMIGSLLMLLGIIILYTKYGTTSNELLNIKINMITQGIEEKRILIIIWGLIFFSFMIKIPMFPFHTWLPLAHSDAPTIGSIILAALLLKIGSFGIIRYSIYIFEPISIYKPIIPIIYILSIISIYNSSIISIRGIYDIKKIIAYSSIIHMNFSIFGLFSKMMVGLVGATLLMYTHALISSALFILVGIIYKRYHSRNIIYYKGLSYSMPIYTFLFLFFSFANMSLPFCSSFLSELFILISSFYTNPIISIILLISLIISSYTSLWLANRLLFGSKSKYILYYKDITINEIIAIMPLLIITIILTFHPQPLISIITLPLMVI